MQGHAPRKIPPHTRLSIRSLCSAGPGPPTPIARPRYLYVTPPPRSTQVEEIHAEGQRSEHGVCSLYNGLFGGSYRLVRADFKKDAWGMGRIKSVSAVWEAVMDFQLAHFVLQAVRDGRHGVFEADDSTDRNVISLTQVHSSRCQHCEGNFFFFFNRVWVQEKQHLSSRDTKVCIAAQIGANIKYSDKKITERIVFPFHSLPLPQISGPLSGNERQT